MRKTETGERGFALLLVFVLAACVAISLYMELPRVAFEAQRDKEQVLVDRGQEYVTAIRRYYQKFGRFPTKVEDLENTNNIRFLRKRYVDPMTGKDDWRFIHVGPGGAILDSLVQKGPGLSLLQKPPGLNGNQQGQGQGQDQFAFNTNTPPASSDANQPTEVNPALLRRPSDRTAPASGNPGEPDQDPNLPADEPGGEQNLVPEPGQPEYPAQGNLQQPGQQPGVPGQPGYPQQAPYPPQPGQPGYPPQPGQPGYPMQAGYPQQPGQPGYPPQPGQPGYPLPPPGVPGVPGRPYVPYPQGAQDPNTNPAILQIQQQLASQQQPGGTTAFGNGAPGSNSPFGNGAPGSNSPFGNNQVLGGGIVGVASKLAMPGIKEFDHRRKYNEWEFIFDMKKTNGMPGQAQFPQFGGQGQPVNPTAPASSGSSPSPLPQQPSQPVEQ